MTLTITIYPGNCSAKYPNSDTEDFNNAVVKQKTYIRIMCHDQYDNSISIGGEVVTSNILLAVDKRQTSITPKLIDNNNGTYDIEFNPIITGKYDISIYIE